MRLIDADALIVAMLDHGVDHAQMDDLDEINQIINDAPTVDAVPVVRCRDCKWGKKTSKEGIFYHCGNPYEQTGKVHLRNWYCPGGAQKEDKA